MTTARARAHANIALVKYWGKRNLALNLPAAGSLSLTLRALTTEARVSFTNHHSEDKLFINGKSTQGTALSRLSRWLDIVRRAAHLKTRAVVETTSNFPVSSGLASSAAAYAALALAASRAAELEIDQSQLSILARQGSGSAARSLFGGFVLMHAGVQTKGSDSYAEPVRNDWANQLAMVVVVVDGGRKKQYSSRDAMNHCQKTSPLYTSWIHSVDNDLQAAQQAIAAENLHELGVITEASALTMHASMWAARPPIIYWQPTTLKLLVAVKNLRQQGVLAYATIDAGPHVKVLCHASDMAAITTYLKAIPGVTYILESPVGGPAELIQ